MADVEQIEVEESIAKYPIGIAAGHSLLLRAVGVNLVWREQPRRVLRRLKPRSLGTRRRENRRAHDDVRLGGTEVLTMMCRSHGRGGRKTRREGGEEPDDNGYTGP
jgi:uncharacterized iron-regulated membrane protein